MAQNKNFMLGNGERLANPHEIKRSGRKKPAPYTFEQARKRLSPKIRAAADWSKGLAREACANNEVVLRLAIHPRYISKTDYPSVLFNAISFRPIGRRPIVISPEAWGIKTHPEDAVTDEIFVATDRSRLQDLSGEILNWSESHAGASELAQIERIEPFAAEEKIQEVPEDLAVILELVLHNAGNPNSIHLFAEYAQRFNAEVITERHRVVGGMSFVPVRMSRKFVDELAQFSLVRVVRGMPTIRPLPDPIIRSARKKVSLPKTVAVDSKLRAAIFDGGIPSDCLDSLAPWVNLIEPAGIGPSDPDLEQHGLAVTSSFLFGPLGSDGAASQPVYCPVDHVRVLDSSPATDFEYFDVLDRILTHLDEASPPYKYINLSLGPPLPIADDEITLWTAEIDSRLSHGHSVVTVATGNDGDKDADMQLNRIQPPSDAVNVVSVGAASSESSKWQRADYSCVGPGRCPGFFKPDGLAFGGSDDEMFLALGNNMSLVGCTGTSFAAPYTLRSIAGVDSNLATPLSALALRALVVHRAKRRRKQKQSEVGWGRFEPDPDLLITCDDEEALVVYQGTLPVTKHLRASLPIPSGPLPGYVEITATLAIAPETDAADPSTYTRGGLQVTFRPDDQAYTENNGRRSKEPESKDFFSRSRIYKQPEYDLRKDGHKWEPCLRATRRIKGSDLQNPVFDIYYHHRRSGRVHPDPKPIPYALIVSLRGKDIPDMYNRVLASYQAVLVPVQPKTSIPIQAARIET